MQNYKINMVFLCTGFGNSPVISGGEKRLFNIVKRLPTFFNPVFITTEGGLKALQLEFKKKSYNVIKVISSIFFKNEFLRISRLWSYFLSSIHASIVLLLKNNFDIVYSSSDAFSDIIPSLIYKIKHKKTWIAMLHHVYLPPDKRPGNFLVNYVLYLLQRFSLKIIAKHADVVFVLNTPAGKMLKQILLKYNFKGKFYIVKNGIKIISKRKFKKNKNYAIYIGGLRPSKGIYDIIPIWKKVVYKFPNMKLFIIGQGAKIYLSQLLEEIKKNKLQKNIFYCGYVPNTTLKRYMAKSFLFFFPSYEEGWSISIAEALMYNNHVIVYDLPAYKIFNNQIIKIKRFNTDLFAKKIIDIIKIGKQNYVSMNFLKKFDWEKIAENEYKIFLKIYNQKNHL